MVASRRYSWNGNLFDIIFLHILCILIHNLTDWAIRDLPVEEKYWKELSAAEKEGARYFGYTPATWDETEDDMEAPFYDGDQANDPTPSATKPSSSAEEEKKEEMPDEECATDEEEMTDEEEEEEAAAPAAAAAASSAPKKKKPVKTSRVFGGAGEGKKFRTANFRRIEKLTVFADRHVVRGIEIVSGNRTMVGVKDGKPHEFTLQPNEFFMRAEVRASAKSIQCLTLTTNKVSTVEKEYRYVRILCLLTISCLNRLCTCLVFFALRVAAWVHVEERVGWLARTGPVMNLKSRPRSSTNCADFKDRQMKIISHRWPFRGVRLRHARNEKRIEKLSLDDRLHMEHDNLVLWRCPYYVVSNKHC